ncbi:hypothetical protein JHU04_003132 [Brenneria sp. 4F2]|nr:hypothetical protein [Brenneria bubanii]
MKIGLFYGSTFALRTGFPRNIFLLMVASGLIIPLAALVIPHETFIAALTILQ